MGMLCISFYGPSPVVLPNALVGSFHDLATSNESCGSPPLVTAAMAVDVRRSHRCIFDLAL